MERKEYNVVGGRSAPPNPGRRYFFIEVDTIVFTSDYEQFSLLLGSKIHKYCGYVDADGTFGGPHLTAVVGKPTP